MQYPYFEWKTYSENNGTEKFLIDLLEATFLVNVEKETIWLSEKIAEIFGTKKYSTKTELSFEKFNRFLTDSTQNSMWQELERLVNEKCDRASCHVDVIAKTGILSSVIYLFRLKNKKEFLGFLSIDYEPMREYEQHLDQIIEQLRHTQLVNELMVEGASDYVYQLDLVNNTCTFSSRALEVLPLESPTFSDAMNRVLSFIIPEDRQIFLDSFIPFLSGRSDFHVAEYRVMTKQGNIMWISCKGKGIHDEEGHPLMIAGSLMDITEQKKHEEEIEKMLYYDVLTGLKNKLCFEKDMKKRLEETDAKGSLLYIDIRKFKLYNELFGHSIGNSVLQEFAYMLRLYFSRAIDIYRFSGDEFLVHLPEHDKQEILDKIVPFKTNLKKMREIDGHTIFINTYIAVAIYPEYGNNVEVLLNNVNQCLYKMIREDKADVNFFSGTRENNISQQFFLENELQKDIEDDFKHFRVVYQPIIEFDGEEHYWIGAEALLRYNNPVFPDLDQMELIQCLEYSSMILSVGRWVIKKALHECRRWSSSEEKPVVHVNMAAQQVADAGLIEYILEQCKKEEVLTSQLILELTETSLIKNMDMATAFCEKALDCGICISLDDFGSGYSGLNYLRSLPLTQIKVDREYTSQLTSNSYNKIIVSTLQKLAENLNLELCVEGVETEEELRLLREMGVVMVQGFYFERPLEADVIRREFPGKIQVQDHRKLKN